QGAQLGFHAPLQVEADEATKRREVARQAVVLVMHDQARPLPERGDDEPSRYVPALWPLPPHLLAVKAVRVQSVGEPAAPGHAGEVTGDRVGTRGRGLREDLDAVGLELGALDRLDV